MPTTRSFRLFLASFSNRTRKSASIWRTIRARSHRNHVEVTAAPAALHRPLPLAAVLRRGRLRAGKAVRGIGAFLPGHGHRPDRRRERGRGPARAGHRGGGGGPLPDGHHGPLRRAHRRPAGGLRPAPAAVRRLAAPRGAFLQSAQHRRHDDPGGGRHQPHSAVDRHGHHSGHHTRLRHAGRLQLHALLLPGAHPAAAAAHAVHLLPRQAPVPADGFGVDGRAEPPLGAGGADSGEPGRHPHHSGDGPGGQRNRPLRRHQRRLRRRVLQPSPDQLPDDRLDANAGGGLLSHHPGLRRTSGAERRDDARRLGGLLHVRQHGGAAVPGGGIHRQSGAARGRGQRPPVRGVRPPSGSTRPAQRRGADPHQGRHRHARPDAASRGGPGRGAGGGEPRHPSRRDGRHHGPRGHRQDDATEDPRPAVRPAAGHGLHRRR